jgi:hypothetical protein
MTFRCARCSPVPHQEASAGVTPAAIVAHERQPRTLRFVGNGEVLSSRVTAHES